VIRVVLPAQLRGLAGAPAEVTLDVADEPSAAKLLDALETRYPALLGAIRDANTGQRRAFVRCCACEEDLSHEPSDAPLPPAAARGDEPFIILGAIAGG